MNKIIPLACLAVLAGCGVFQQRQTFLNSLVGQPETELVRRMGAPNRTYETGGHRFLTYDERQLDVRPTFGYWGGFWGPSYYYGAGFYPYYGGGPARVLQWSCETTFDLANNRVQSWTLRGNGCD